MNEYEALALAAAARKRKHNNQGPTSEVESIRARGLQRAADAVRKDALERLATSSEDSMATRFQQIMRAAANAERAGDEGAARKLVGAAITILDGSQSTNDQPARGPQQELALARVRAEQQRQSQASEVGHPVYREVTTPTAVDPTAPSVGDAGGISAAVLDGGMLGFGDEYLAGLSSALGVQPDGQGGADWFDYSKPIGERYSTALDAIRNEQVDFAEANPGKALSGEMAGAVLGPGKGMGQFINAGKTTAARLGRGGLAGGGSAGAYGFGEGENSVSERGLSGALSAPVGLVGGGMLTVAGQGFSRALQSLRGRPEAAQSMASVESIRAAATKLYEKIDASGVSVPGSRIASLAKSVQNQMKSAGYDQSLHPRVKAVIRRLEDESGPKTLSEMEILRRVASNAAQSAQPDERRLAAKIVDRIDLVTQSVGGGKAGKEARDLWARARRLETIEGAIEKAATFDNFEKALQSQFKTLLRNKKALRGFKPAEIKAIRQVAMGTTPQKAFKALGDTLSINTLSGIGATGGAIALDAGVSSVALPLTGSLSRRAANALTRRGAERARATVASDGVAPQMAVNPYATGVAPTTSQIEELKAYLTGGG